MDCRCDELTRFDGTAAARYAKEHLRLLAADESGWVLRYQCPNSNQRWLMTFPDSQVHGGGQPLLVRAADAPSPA